jgi:hypothetical protein
MNFEWKFNQGKMVALINQRNQAFKDAMETEWKKNAFQYIGYMVVNFYSGRPGLWRQSGFLARFWLPAVQWVGNVLSAKIVNWQAPYGIYHDESYKPQSEPRKVPVRTFVVRDFNTVGLEFFARGIKKVLRKF